MKKIFFSYTLGLATGILFFYFFQFDTSKRANTSEIAFEIQSIQEVENADLKNQKAMQLLEKIIKLLMVDIGLRLDNVKTDTHITEPGTQNNALMNETEILVQKIDESDRKSAEQKLNSVNETQVALSRNLGGAEILQMLQKIDSEEQIQTFLNLTALKNADQLSLLKNDVNKASFYKFSGSYSGELKMTEGSSDLVTMKAEFMPMPVTGSSVEAETTIELVKNGKPFSTSSGRGSLRGFKSFDSEQSSMVFKGCGEECYYHFFKSPNLDFIFGNYYREKKGSWKKAGEFILYKH
jgi:hypothetical protein